MKKITLLFLVAILLLGLTSPVMAMGIPPHKNGKANPHWPGGLKPRKTAINQDDQ